MENAFRIHAAVLADQNGCEGVRVVAFNGKTLRGSFDHFADRAAIHLVSAFDVTSAMVLGHIEVGEKENEIPVVQRLLAELGLARRVVTADAMHCQKTFDAARDGDAVFIGRVKGNRPSLLDAVRSLCEAAEPAERIQTKKRHRGRQEIRTIDVFPIPDRTLDPGWQPLLTTVIRIYRQRMDRSSRSALSTSRNDEVADDVTNAATSAAVAAAAIRGLPYADEKEAPAWEAIAARAEDYPAGMIPLGGLLLVAGVDVQRDRIECEVAAFGRNGESWSVDYRVFHGEPFQPQVWADLDALLQERFPHAAGGSLTVERLAIDSDDGMTTQAV